VDRILSILFTAGASVFLKHAIEVSHPFQAYLGWAIGCCCLSWFSFGLGSLQTKPTIQPETVHESGSERLRKSGWTGNDYALLIGSGLSFLVMQGATVWLFANMQIGYALALFQLSSMIQVYLGRRIFREEQFVRRLVASGIMTLGAILVLVAK
jgi:drug/metabolite transporter (DMT)-like permease